MNSKTLNGVAEEKVYRLRHIQGIRALSIIFVLLYHFEIGEARYGYLGVDMFLVISGYVMTISIMRSLSQGRFSYINFMAGRYWRLYPTLIFTLLVSLLVFSQLLDRERFQDLKLSAVYSLLGLKNVQEMFRKHGYFETEAKSKPFLHIWSLSLEQQFYFIYPIVLSLAYKFRRVRNNPRMYISLILLFLSFTFSGTGQYLSHSISSTRFYFILNRFYQFCLGGILTFVTMPKRNKVSNKPFNLFHTICNEIGTGFGLCLATQVAFGNIPKAGDPTGCALFVTCLLILTPESRLSYYFLQNKIAVNIGEASYTIYMLHWPVWVFFSKIQPCYEFKKSFLLILVLACLAIISFICFRFVEEPFRQRRGMYFPRFPVVSLLIFSILAFNLFFEPKLAKKFEIQKIGSSIYRLSKYPILDAPKALIHQKDRPMFQGMYTNGEADISKNLTGVDAMFVGDSFAGHLSEAARMASKRLGLKVFLISKLSCGFDYTVIQRSEKCLRNSEFYMKAVRLLRPKTIFVCRLWDLFVGSPKWDNKSVIPNAMKEHFEGMEKALLQYSEKVVFVGTTPRFTGFSDHEICVTTQNRILGFFIPNYESKRQRYTPEAKALKTNRLMKRYFSSICKSPRVGYLDMFSVFCKKSDRQCELYSTTNYSIPKDVQSTKLRPIFLDDGRHLSVWGSWALSPLLDKYL